MSAPTRSVPDDLVQPFRIDPFALRGRLVRLGPAIDRILSQHAYPTPVAAMLGEAITLAVVLAGALKYDGIFTLQTKGDGPIRLMVADVSTDGAVRGYAQYDQAKLDAVTTAAAGAGVSLSVPRLLGGGYIAFTVDQGEETDRYQGIVELAGATLADCAQHYFRQSEQIQAGIKLAVGQTGPGDTWRAGGLMLQRVPPEGGYGVIADDVEDGWRRAMVLMSSATSDELIDPGSLPASLIVPAVSRRWGSGFRHPPARSALPLLARADREDPARLSRRRTRRHAKGAGNHRHLRVLQPPLHLRGRRNRPPRSGIICTTRPGDGRGLRSRVAGPIWDGGGSFGRPPGYSLAAAGAVAPHPSPLLAAPGARGFVAAVARGGIFGFLQIRFSAGLGDPRHGSRKARPARGTDPGHAVDRHGAGVFGVLRRCAAA